MPSFKTIAEGRYIVQDILGEGGVARVHRGYDRRTGGECAIKLLLPTLQRYPRIQERFEREAEVLKALQHENIVQIYDHGITEDHHWLVMELVSGGSLVQRVRAEGAFDAERVIRIGQQTCNALEVAHREGIIHRDIKPGNILVTEEDQIKVVDFGICHVSRATRVLTKVGVRMGSVRFMAPEQRVDAGSVGAPADVFGLGMTLLSLLLGRTPKRPEEELVALGDQVSNSLAHVILRATLQDPEHRYESAAQMGRALQIDSSD